MGVQTDAAVDPCWLNHQLSSAASHEEVLSNTSLPLSAGSQRSSDGCGSFGERRGEQSNRAQSAARRDHDIGEKPVDYSSPYAPQIQQGKTEMSTRAESDPIPLFRVAGRGPSIHLMSPGSQLGTQSKQMGSETSSPLCPFLKSQCPIMGDGSVASERSGRGLTRVRYNTSSPSRDTAPMQSLPVSNSRQKIKPLLINSATPECVISTASPLRGMIPMPSLPVSSSRQKKPAGYPPWIKPLMSESECSTWRMTVKCSKNTRRVGSFDRSRSTRPMSSMYSGSDDAAPRPKYMRFGRPSMNNRPMRCGRSVVSHPYCLPPLVWLSPMSYVRPPFTPRVPTFSPSVVSYLAPSVLFMPVCPASIPPWRHW